MLCDNKILHTLSYHKIEYSLSCTFKLRERERQQKTRSILNLKCTRITRILTNSPIKINNTMHDLYTSLYSLSDVWHIPMDSSTLYSIRFYSVPFYSVLVYAFQWHTHCNHCNVCMKWICLCIYYENPRMSKLLSFNKNE